MWTLGTDENRRCSTSTTSPARRATRAVRPTAVDPGRFGAPPYRVGAAHPARARQGTNRLSPFAPEAVDRCGVFLALEQATKGEGTVVDGGEQEGDAEPKDKHRRDKTPASESGVPHLHGP